MATLNLRQITKSFGSVAVIHGVTFDIEDGEFVVFVGPSGCGKSTLLRMICGLESVSSGEVLIDGEVVNDVPSARRGLALVFQSYALYPHMTVYQNMAEVLQPDPLAGAPDLGVGEGEIDAEAERIGQEHQQQRQRREQANGDQERLVVH